MTIERQRELAEKFHLVIWGWPDLSSPEWVIMDRLDKAEKSIEELHAMIISVAKGPFGQ